MEQKTRKTIFAVAAVAIAGAALALGLIDQDQFQNVVRACIGGM